MAIDLVVALWAPADLIIEDAIALTVGEIDALTNVAMPAPPYRRFQSTGGLEVTVSGTFRPEKTPFQLTEWREYHSSEEESRYQLKYRYTRTA